MDLDTNAYIGVKKEPKLVVVTVNEKKHSELDTNAAPLKRTHHEVRLVKTGKFL